MAKKNAPEVEVEVVDGADANPPADTPAPALTLRTRITIGGRGAKKPGADGKGGAPAEPTVEVYKGDLDLSALADPANAVAVRNLAATVVIKAVEETLRAARRAQFASVCDATSGTTEEKGTAVSAVMLPADAGEVAAAVAAVLAGAPDPFAPKPTERLAGATAKLKAEVASKDDLLARIHAKVAEIGAAVAAGDFALVAALQEEVKAMS